MRQRQAVYGLLFLCVLAATQGCTQPQQQVNNSNCVTLNSTIHSQKYGNLTAQLGTDVVEAAVAAVKGSLGMTPQQLTTQGTDAAVRTAAIKGKQLGPQDKAALEKYLRDEAIPAISANPTCTINQTSSAKPYFIVQQVKFLDPNPTFVIKNSGQGEGQVQISIRQFVDGIVYSGGTKTMILGPGQTSSVETEKPRLPVFDIQSGKSKLRAEIKLSYLPEPGVERKNIHQIFLYDHSTQRYFQIPD